MVNLRAIQRLPQHHRATGVEQKQLIAPRTIILLVSTRFVRTEQDIVLIRVLVVVKSGLLVSRSKIPASTKDKANYSEMRTAFSSVAIITYFTLQYY
jgi:hypothetical protein